MCGRYVVYTDAEYEDMRNIVRSVEHRLSIEEQLKTGEIFPKNLAPVLTQGNAMPMVWGFPRWNGGGAVINARAETAVEKRMFRQSLFTRRLVIPSTGFFEWQRVKGRKLKDKYLLRLPGTPMLYMAGMYNLYKLPDGREEARFVILTTEANESVSVLHNRMPVILAPKEIQTWLSNEDFGQFLYRAGPKLLLEKVL